jgi:hypothetical protein
MYTEFLDGLPEGERPFVRLAHKMEDNIKMGVKEIICENVD